MIEIVVASFNKGKVKEIAAALSTLPVNVLSLSDFNSIPEAVESGDTFEKNAILKATHYCLCTGKLCLADDSGLEVDALGGAPGVYSARYAGEMATDSANNEKLLNALIEIPKESRSARFRCVLALVGPMGMLTTTGTCEGRILQEPRGTGGFGYDPLFYVEDLGKTLSEVSLDQKNEMSHRGQALKNMNTKLVRFFHENRCD